MARIRARVESVFYRESQILSACLLLGIFSALCGKGF